jgi:hypothetical protein
LLRILRSKQSLSTLRAARKTARTIKMGLEFKAQATHKSHGKKFVKVSGNRWLSTQDITKE